ncbi:unnamed protein product [Dibothriocephalus latus]|uniref:Uncharacterized protein n=1 Tax=Dibothriocephalus latus TaxID=60516 RepID=A0A3P7LLK3_DIBLA|nr:unnamed protein product [Dibothriocephalus latus]
MVAAKLCAVDYLSVVRRLNFIVEFSLEEDIKEKQLLLLLFYPPEFYLKKDFNGTYVVKPVSGIIDWVPTKISPPDSALFRDKNDCSSSPRCLPNVASQMMPLKVVTPLMRSNPTSLLASSVLKPEPNEESMSTSELRLYRACISNGVDVSSWPVHEEAGYKDKIEKFRLLNRQARARVRRKVAPPSKSRQASLGEAAQPMDLSIPEDSSRMSSTGSIPLNPPIPPVVVANISGWVLPVQTPTVANEEPAANRILLLQNTSFPPILPRPPMDPPAPSLSSIFFLSSHIPLPTPPSSSSSSSVPSERNHLQAPALLPDEPTTDNQLPPKPSSSPKAARKRKSTKPMRRLFLKDLVTPQTYTPPVS